MLDILFFGYIFFILIAINNRKYPRKDYLSIEGTMDLRGIAAIGIILHHMSERTSGGLFFSQLPMVGYLLVAFFFFLSGYGLIIQYEKRGALYLHGFLEKRVGYLLIIYLLDIAFYAIIGNLLGKHYTFWFVIKSFFISGVAANSWYMIIQILLYITFYVVFAYLKTNNTSTKIFFIFIAELLFAIFCIVSDISGTWYLSNLGFVAGMLWATNKTKIDTLLKSHYWVLFFSFSTIFVILYILPVITDRTFSETFAFGIRTVCRLFSSSLAAIEVILLTWKLRPRSAVWDFIGKISLEIYLIHGSIYMLLRSNLINIQNDFLWALLTVIISIVVSYPIHSFNMIINQKISERYTSNHQ